MNYLIQLTAPRAGTSVTFMRLLTFAMLGLLSCSTSFAKPHESIAVHSAQVDVEYSSGEQENRVAAALAAQDKCKQATAELSGYCELVRMDSIEITTGARLKSDNTRRPLFLWRYQSGTSTVYLAGSLHLLKQSIYPLPAQYEQAFELSDKLVLEVNTTALSPSEINAKTQAAARLTEQRYLRESFNAEDYSRLANVASLYGIPLQSLQFYKPAMAYTQLSLMGFVALGYDPDLGVETYFTQRKSSQDILQLETLDLQLGYLFDQPKATQIAVLMDTVNQFAEIESAASDLVRAWASGNDITLAKLIADQYAHSELLQQFSEQLLDKRNAAMSEKIVGYLNSNESYFVIVGAAHLAGEHSIINLLKGKGINGQRIYSNDVDL